MKKNDFCKEWQFAEQGNEKKPVILPHDAMLLSGREADAPSGSGEAFYRGGIYEYEKHFVVPEEWKDKRIVLQFEGIYQKVTVSVNGKELVSHSYGYTPFFVELADVLNYGAENVMEVVADNSLQPCSRWYTGGGIYRPVWLWVGEKDSVLPEEIKVTTLAINPAKVKVELNTKNVNSTIEILDGEKVIASWTGTSAEMEIPDAKLWSEETPHLYICKVGNTEVKFGIREISWSTKGLFINGKETLLKGACIHHDNGIVGAASFPESEWRRVKILKEAGYNAIRSAHNPISTAALDACDELGMYVMDEGWDMWYNHKTRHDYATDFMGHYEEDIEAMVARDYNHPSVIMYSIGNEVSEPARTKGVELAQKLADKFRSLDETRIITGGMNLSIIKGAAGGKGVYNEEEGGMNSDNSQSMQAMNSTVFNMVTSIVGSGMNKAANSDSVDKVVTPLLNILDVCGYNYASGRYPLEGKKHPERIVVGSETFPQDIAKNWAMVKKYPYLIGDFMWTGWDYLGENGLGAWAYSEDGKGFGKPWPWKLADTGAFDILGNPTAEVFWAQAAWDCLENPAISMQPINHGNKKPAKMTWRGSNGLPSYSYRGCEGTKGLVEVFTQADKVELFVNGKSVGKKKVKNCQAKFKVTYCPGEIKAVAYDAAGKKLGESLLKSSIGKLRIKAEVERPLTDSMVRYVDISLVGENNIVESNADQQLSVAVEGGTLLGFGSANPRTEEEFDTGSYETYYGKAQAMILLDEKKQACLTISGKGLDDVVIQIQ